MHKINFDIDEEVTELFDIKMKKGDTKEFQLLDLIIDNSIENNYPIIILRIPEIGFSMNISNNNHIWFHRRLNNRWSMRVAWEFIGKHSTTREFTLNNEKDYTIYMHCDCKKSKIDNYSITILYIDIL